jgi:hypothetical protein
MADGPQRTMDDNLRVLQHLSSDRPTRWNDRLSAPSEPSLFLFVLTFVVYFLTNHFLDLLVHSQAGHVVPEVRSFQNHTSTNP